MWLLQSRQGTCGQCNSVYSWACYVIMSNTACNTVFYYFIKVGADSVDPEWPVIYKLHYDVPYGDINIRKCWKCSSRDQHARSTLFFVWPRTKLSQVTNTIHYNVNVSYGDIKVHISVDSVAPEECLYLYLYHLNTVKWSIRSVVMFLMVTLKYMYLLTVKPFIYMVLKMSSDIQVQIVCIMMIFRGHCTWEQCNSKAVCVNLVFYVMVIFV